MKTLLSIALALVLALAASRGEARERTWTAWEPVPDPKAFAKQPTAVKVASWIYVFGVDASGRIWYQRVTVDGLFTGVWTEVPDDGRTKFPVGAVGWENPYGGTIRLFVTGLDNRIWEKVLLITTSSDTEWWSTWYAEIGNMAAIAGPVAAGRSSSYAIFAPSPTRKPHWLRGHPWTETTGTAATAAPYAGWEYIPPYSGTGSITTVLQMAATFNAASRNGYAEHVPAFSVYATIPWRKFRLTANVYRRTYKIGDGWNGKQWDDKGWIRLEGLTDHSPAVTTDYMHVGLGEEYLFLRGLDGQAWYRSFNLNTHVWDGWSIVPDGTFKSAFAVATFHDAYTLADRPMYLFGLGMDDCFWWAKTLDVSP